MENTGNIEQAVESPAGQSMAASSTSSAPKEKRSTANVSLTDRLSILQSAVNALASYGVETGANQFYSDGRRVVAIYMTGDVELVDGRLVAINGKVQP